MSGGIYYGDPIPWRRWARNYITWYRSYGLKRERDPATGMKVVRFPGEWR